VVVVVTPLAGTWPSGMVESSFCCSASSHRDFRVFAGRSHKITPVCAVDLPHFIVVTDSGDFHPPGRLSESLGIRENPVGDNV
jgi:hypothetical protein